jgi:hypothetical protein
MDFVLRSFIIHDVIILFYLIIIKLAIIFKYLLISYLTTIHAIFELSRLSGDARIHLYAVCGEKASFRLICGQFEAIR